VCDPQFLTDTARAHLREVFLTRKAALTGVNFAIAETGEIVVCTNEGNADMGTNLADVHIASMGIEKLIPEKRHLEYFSEGINQECHRTADYHLFKSF